MANTPLGNNILDAPMTTELCWVMGVIRNLRRYSNKEVNRAGDVLRDVALPPASHDAALAVIEEWRTAHEGASALFREHLERHAKDVDRDSNVVSRLKRQATIENKLVRQPNMRLSTMQDVGGLRAIVRSPAEVHALAERLLSVPQFDLVRQRSYIPGQAESGYRGVHLVYACRAGEGDPPAIDGLKIEVQLRSRLQHAWATAVEVVGTFRRELLKAGEGSPEWLRFFTLAGAVVAKKESTPIGPHVPTDEGAFRDEFHALRASLRVYDRLKTYSISSFITEPNSLAKWSGGDDDRRYFILSFDVGTGAVSASPFLAVNFEGARRLYEALEREHNENPDIDTVLVTAMDLGALREAYPNYYADTTAFADLVYEDDPQEWPRPQVRSDS